MLLTTLEHVHSDWVFVCMSCLTANKHTSDGPRPHFSVHDECQLDVVCYCFLELCFHWLTYTKIY